MPGHTSFKFNPGFLSDAEAIEGFLVRRRELTRILDWLSSPPFQGFAPDHLLVVAPRGAGKTTLVRRALAEVRTDEMLKSAWHPIFLGEESYTVTTPGEFFLECLFHLQDQLGEPHWKQRYELAARAHGEEALLADGLAALVEFSKRSDKQLLVIVENLSAILNDQIGDQAEILLQKAAEVGSLRLLATSLPVSADDGPEPAWLKHFEKIELKPLAPDECATLWAALTGADAKPSRVRPLQILTGGSPRLLHVLAEFMRTPSLHDLMDNLNLLIDQNTEYFKSQLDALPTTERKVFAALLDIWDPSTAKDVAEAARVNVNVASAMLARLHDRGAVIKEPGKGRAATYYASERLFNIYYLMRRRSHPSSRVRALVDFMTRYYDRDELIDTTALLAAEACTVAPANRTDYHNTFGAILARTPATIRSLILERTPAEFLATLPAHIHDYSESDNSAIEFKSRTHEQRRSKISGNLRQPLSQAKKAFESGDIDRAEQLLRAALDDFPDNQELWFRLALVLSAKPDASDEAIEVARRSVELAPEDSFSSALLGRLFLKSGRKADAKLSLQRALDLDPNNTMAISNLASVRLEEGDTESALQFYKRAFEIEPTETSVSDYGSALLNAKRLEDAERLVRPLVEKNPSWRKARHLLGHILYDRGKYVALERILRRALSRPSADWREWAELAEFLWKRHRTSEARKAYDTAIERKPTSAFVYADYSMLLTSIGESDRAIKLARTGVELEPSSYYASVAMGSALAKSAREQEAEQYFRAGVEQRPSAFTWYHLGAYLAQQERRLADAEAALRNAISSDKSYPCAVPHRLAEVLIHQGRDQEADDILAKSASENPRCFCARVARGDIASRAGRDLEARQHYDEGLRLDPTSVEALTRLASVSAIPEASKFIDRALSIAPGDPAVLLARAKQHYVQGRMQQSLVDLRSVLAQRPALVEARLWMVKVLADQQKFAEALEHFADSVRAVVTRRDLVPLIVDAAVTLASHGRGEDVERALVEAEVIPVVEPLYFALLLVRGERPLVAKEIEEVAIDIAKQMNPAIAPVTSS